MDVRPRTETESAISPVHRIPAEILAEIFALCVQNSMFRYTDGRWYPNFFYSLNNPRESPTALAHVCAFWRDLATKTPRLWDRLTIYFPTTKLRGVENHTASIVEDLVHRSKPHPITVVIGSTDFKYENGVPLDFLSTLASLEDFCDRVDTLSLQLAVPYFQYLVANVPTPRFSRLGTITLQLAPIRDWKITLDDILMFFKSSPNLQSLHLDYADLTADISTPTFPWTNLTDLHLTSPLDFFQIHVILALCTNLRRCQLDGIDNGPWQVPDRTLHTLPALETLRVLTTTDLPTSVLLNPFTLPNLRHLEASLSGWTSAPLLALQRRSRFALISLRLDHVYIDTEDFLRFLAAAPTLECLHLSDFLSQGVISALRYHSGQSSDVLLPALKELSLEANSSELVAEGDELVDMIVSRWDLVLRTNNAPAFARLTKVDLQVTGDVLGERAEAVLRELGAAGVVEDHDLRGIVNVDF
ncbi:hypothetical protein C8R43DRAFT_1001478 [Mycena crocata]|nr:hypothetical protein C8R43DRAFT_1001478 [Mycena crocata]